MRRRRRAAPVGLATFVLPAGAHACRGEAAAGTPTEGVAGDRCALDGSACVRRGPYCLGRYDLYGEQNEGYAFEREGSVPGVWVPSRWPVNDWWREPEKPATLILLRDVCWI